MSDPIEQLKELLREAASLEDGAFKVQLLEQAVQLADTHGHLEAGFFAREQLVAAALMSGQPDIMLVAYSWCLAQHDRDPQRFPNNRLLFRYRWVTYELPEFPHIPREQILSMMDDMTRRYQQAGSTLRGVYLLRRNVAVRMGDREAAAAAHRDWCKSQRDALSDGVANEQEFLFRYLLWDGKTEEGIAAAEKLLNGPLGKGYDTDDLYSALMVPYWRIGQVDRAVTYHQKGYRLICRRPPYRHLIDYGQHLTLLTLTDNLAAGLRVFERMLPITLTTASIAKRFHAFLACQLFLDRLLDQEKEVLTLRLPSTFVLHDPSGRYRIADLAGWFRGQLSDLAPRFDARNGNDYFGRRLAELEEFKLRITPCPLSGRARS